MTGWGKTDTPNWMMLKMKKNNLLTSFIACAIFAGYILESQAVQAPLSCNMQMMLNGIVALNRDTGRSRNSAEIAISKEGELTKKEIKTILDRVYIVGKNQSPDEIKDAVYRACQNGR